jgi:hypothetical protein
MSDQTRRDPLSDEALEGKTDEEVAEISERESAHWFTFAATVTVRAYDEQDARRGLEVDSLEPGVPRDEGGWGPEIQIGDLIGVEPVTFEERWLSEQRAREFQRRTGA